MADSSKNPQLVRGTKKRLFLYRQLAAILRRDIESGALKPGESIPSMDSLAATHKVNKATVRQALAELTAAGLIFSIPAKGTFVAEPRASSRTIDPNRTLTVGWISRVSGLAVTGRYHTEIMDALRAALPAIRGNLMVVSTMKQDPASFCRTVGETQLDGAILAGPFFDVPIHHLLKSGLPSVLIDDTCRGVPADSILVDNRGGGFQAVQHLLSLGHRRLAFVGGPKDWQITQDRLAGAREALTEAGLQPESVPVFWSDYSPEGGEAALMELMKRKPRPTGVFFFNDEMASGALRALYKHFSIRIPQEMSFVGFDDISWAALTHPPLTTIRVDKVLIGRKAAERLGAQLRGESEIPLTTVIPTALVTRESTAAPPPGQK